MQKLWNGVKVMKQKNMIDMSPMKELGNYSNCTDIITRIALVALANSCDSKLITETMDFITECLSDVYQEEEIAELVLEHKKAALQMRAAIEERNQEGSAEEI